LLDGLDASVELIDHRGLDWSRVRRTDYLLHQRLRYEYPGPIRDLRQQLVVFPPDLHGSQRLVRRHLQVSVPGPELHEEIDSFGNRVCHLFLPRIEWAVEFDIRFLVERNVGLEDGAPAEMTSPSYLHPSKLTQPSPGLTRIANQLAAAGSTLDLAQRANEWVWRNISYEHGVTDVKSTASDVLSLGRGVCQDHAHVMLALCRILGLPARYVSGHLLGEGATHAWVEVLAPDPDTPDQRTVQAFDPSRGRRCRPDYITVAVGRDYADVAPTSGTFVAPYGGSLRSFKLAGVTAVEWASGRDGDRASGRDGEAGETARQRAATGPAHPGR
jgi:transglutaminase-like putative cysteine protease